jgi:chromosome segregation ATPase
MVAKQRKEEAARHEAALSEKDKALAEKESLLNTARDAESKATAANQQLKTQVEAAEADKKAKDSQLDQAQKNVASVTRI